MHPPLGTLSRTLREVTHIGIAALGALILVNRRFAWLANAVCVRASCMGLHYCCASVRYGLLLVVAANALCDSSAAENSLHTTKQKRFATLFLQ